jgi:hypothetical protein
MVAKDQLFTLVKSLSQGEKAFFLKALPQSTKKDESTDYIALFYGLDKLEEYDEEKLIEKLPNKTFTKHLSVVKNYLFHLILKHLKSYHNESSAKSELFELLQDAEILINKALNRESYRVYLKVEKIAEKHELFTFSLEACDRLLRLNYDLLSEIESSSYSLEIYQKQEVILSKIAELTQLKHLRNVRNSLDFIKEPRDVKMQKQLALLEHPLLQDDYKFKSYKAGGYYYHIRSRILMDCDELDKKEKAYKILEELIAHLESDAELLHENLNNYIIALTNLVCVHHEIRTNDDETSLKIIDKISAIKTENQYLKYRIHEKVIVNMLYYYLFSKKHSEGVAYIAQIEKEFIENEDLYNPTFFIAALNYFSMLCFLVGEYSKALKWVNTILGYKSSSMRMDIQCFSRILNMMIHYELGNYDHVEYILKPTENYLIKHKFFTGYHKAIILFMKDVTLETNKIQIQKKFKELSASLSVLENMDSERVFFLMFNFREWADMKAES